MTLLQISLYSQDRNLQILINRTAFPSFEAECISNTQNREDEASFFFDIKQAKE